MDPFSRPLFQLGVSLFSISDMLLFSVGVIILSLLFFLIMARRSSRLRAIVEEQAVERARDAEIRMGEILKSQSELQGRMQMMAELFGSRQSELNQALRERLDNMTNSIGSTLTEQTKSTHENLSKLQERLAVIDTAQNNIQQLAGQVVQLQAILANKQTRGAFGQSRMEAIIADSLPQGAYEFQATLSNGNRPDCLVRMPNGVPPLVIDAKFPLEIWNEIRSAEGSEANKIRINQFRRNIEMHIRDVAQKYLIVGETQDTAFLFVPSESIFAEIHEHFESLVQKAYRAHIIIVSPSLLMLSIQVIQSVLKDARMREQAHLIQGEVIRLMEDISRLDERVRKLQMHFLQANKDIDDILISSAKVTKRSAKIEMLELGEITSHVVDEVPSSIIESCPPRAESKIVDSKTGHLRLRVVEDD